MARFDRVELVTGDICDEELQLAAVGGQTEFDWYDLGYLGVGEGEPVIHLE